MVLERLVDPTARALNAMLPPMIHPSLTEHMLTEAAGPEFAAPIILEVSAVGVPLDFERMGGRPDSQDGFARVYEIIHILHLLVWQFTKAGKDHHHIRITQRLDTDNVGLVQGIDRAVLRV